jgi:hypothetical protein
MPLEIIDPFEKNNESIKIIDPFDEKNQLKPAYGLIGGVSNLYQEMVNPKESKSTLEKNKAIIPGSNEQEIIEPKIIDPTEFEDLNKTGMGLISSMANIYKSIDNSPEKKDTTAFAITTNQLKEVWKEELGISQENRDSLKWLLGNPEQSLIAKFNNYLLDIGAISLDTIVRTTSSAGMLASGVAGDTLNLLYKITEPAIGEVSSQFSGESLSRELNLMMMETLGRFSPAFNSIKGKPNVLKSERTGKEINNIIEYAKENPQQRQEVLQNFSKTIEDQVNNIKQNNDVVFGDAFEPGNVAKRTEILNEIKSNNEKINNNLLEQKIELQKTTTGDYSQKTIDSFTEKEFNRKPALPVHVVKNIVQSSIEFAKENNIRIPKDKLNSEWLQDLFVSRKYDTTDLVRKIAEDNGIKGEDLNTYIFPNIKKSASETAKELRSYKDLNAVKNLFNEIVDPKNKIDYLPPEELGFIRRMSNVQRAEMTTQLATSVRNYISTVPGRQGLDVISSVLELGLQKAITPFVDPIQLQLNKVSPVRRLEGMINSFKQLYPPQFAKMKERVNKILDLFPEERTRLILSYASDLSNAKNLKKPINILDKIATKSENFALWTNTINRLQEVIIRRAIFDSKLSELVDANKKYYNNKTIEQLITDNQLNTLRLSDIKSAVDKALDLNFAKEFINNKSKFDNISLGFIKAVNSLPFLLTAIFPFPRFMMNALRAQYELSPFGAATYLFSKTARKEFLRGDTSVASKAIIGSALLYGAYQFRSSQNAGEKWYEAKIGKYNFDIRPLNPFAAYFFVADIIKRSKEGTLRDLDLTGFASVFLGIRGTTGVYIVDNIIKFFTDIDPKTPKEALLDPLKRVIAESIGAFATPFKNITDIMASFDEVTGLQFKNVKDVSGKETGSPFIDPLLKRFYPKGLPNVTSPTSYITDVSGNPIGAAPIKNEYPIATQLSGLKFVNPKNPAEKELDRLGFQPKDIFTTTKIPELDTAIKNKLSVGIGFGLSTFVESPEYKNFTDAQKSLIIKQVMQSMRENIKSELQKESNLAPYWALYDYNNFDKDTIKVINEWYGKDKMDSVLKEIKRLGKEK